MPAEYKLEELFKKYSRVVGQCCNFIT